MNKCIILLLLLGIGLYLYSRYLRLKKQEQIERIRTANAEIEAFEEDARASAHDKLIKRHKVTIHFKTALQASEIVLTNAKVYISLMNQPNLHARGVQSQSELINSYYHAFQDISNNEKKQIEDFILELLDKLEVRNPEYYNYVKYWLNKICIAKLQNNLESGMPHTIANMVIMDGDWFTNPRDTTLLHEITHVHQRQVPFEFEDVYPKLGYISYDVSEIRGLDGILTLNRNNPDGMSPNWLWKSNNTCWWIGAVFTTATPSNLSDINCVALKLEVDPAGNYYYLKQTPTQLNSLSSFINYFGYNPNNYHPNEMTAKFAEWFLEDTLGTSAGNKYSSYEGYRVYKDYFKNLMTYYQ
jgi:hypothetical protein